MSADGTVRVMDIEAERVAELQREGTIQLIDVREEYEWDEGRIAGARHLALGELTAQAETIDRETPVVFYCRVGGRSAMAANAFSRAGYRGVHDDGRPAGMGGARIAARALGWACGGALIAVSPRGRAAPALVKVGDVHVADVRRPRRPVTSRICT